MKDKIKQWREQFSAIPEALQKQIGIRLIFALVFFLLFVLVLLLLVDWMSCIPFIVLTVYNGISTILLFQRAVVGGYVVILGRCLETTETPIRKRIKSVQLQTDEQIVRVTIHHRVRRIPPGTMIKVYVSNSTQVYDKDGIWLIPTYLAIDLKGDKNRYDQSKRVVSKTGGNQEPDSMQGEP